MKERGERKRELEREVHRESAEGERIQGERVCTGRCSIESETGGRKSGIRVAYMSQTRDLRPAFKS